MKNFKLIAFAALVGVVTTGSIAQAQSATMPAAVKVVKAADTSMLAGANGMTLYTFDKDVDAKSNCNGGCAVAWPPLMAAADAKPVGDYSIVTRDDGTKQWAYKNKALYFYASDKAPMDTVGNHGTWHIVTP
jgi:predicted lipoprotein with Yx(FWY)xxD motif